MRKVGLLALAAPLAVTTAAHAQATAVATPNAAGKASHIQFNVDGTEAPISSRIPSSLAMTTPAGFTVNRQAAPKRCGHTAAALNECPAASQIGTGALVIMVTYQGKSHDVTFNLRMYLRSNNSLLGVTFLAGTRVVPGTLVTTGGLGVVFNPLPAPPVFAQVTYALQSITLDLGVSHRVVTVTHKRIKKGKHRVKRVRIVKRTNVNLIQNPSTCATGSWPATVSLGFPDNTTTTLTTPIACAP
jgi:hypothetical protein